VIERRRSAGRAQTIFVLLVIAIVVFLVWQFIAFQNALGRMPAGGPSPERPPRG
jgi:hypothetical protein